ncbi:uncharacterized protein [Palaemon carinicauda]|uniref:uncharacterized protein isoform X3 n=1 Tax=Palaemon carinicauda TaxID=392227 RepID=UPI0035B6A6AF
MRAAGGVKWDKGLRGVYGPPSQDPNSPTDAFYTPPISGALDIKEIMREKKLIGDVIEPNSLHIIILGYDKYCRMRALLKRLEGVEEEYMKSRIVLALGGFVVPSRRTWMLFCREVFDYPELEGHDLLCNHLLPEVLTDQVVPPAAPKLQGRPRKKRKKQQGDSESESSETSEDIRPRLKGKPGLTAKPNGLRVLDRKNTTRSHLTNVKTEFQTPALNRLIEVDFMSKLHKFMKDRGTPITRVPHIGYRQLNVFELFTKVQQLGGFEAVGEKKMWKNLYDEMSGISPASSSQQAGQSNAAIMKRHYERLLLPYEKFLLQEQKKLYIGNRPNKVKSEPGEPSVSILQVPKVTTKKESGTIPEDLAKRPEITITPIPRSIGSMVPGGPLHDPLSGVPPGLKGLQLADLMTLENFKTTFGMSALQDLAKIAERYEKPLQEPATKKLKTEDGARVNGANSRERGNGRPSVIQETPASKAGLPAVPGLVSADMIRQMNLLEAKLLLPAHQSNKTISAIAQLLPQTSIFPAPAPAAHQPHLSKAMRDHNPIRPDPPRVIQSQSVYSQAKHIYGKPTADVNKMMSVKDTNKSASPEIEILDLSRPTGNKSSKPPKTERPEIELLDLSTRRDITVSPVSKPGTSKNCSSNRIQPPSVSIKSSDHPARQSPNKPQGGANPVSAALAAAQGLPPGLGGLPINPAALLPYLSPMLSPGVKPNSGAGGSPHISIFPFMDLAAYYNMLPQGLIPTTSSSGSSSASTTAAQHMAAQLHLSSLGLSSGLSGLTPDALASLGIYKNFLPQGNLPAPHFLSGLMSPHNHNPPTSK